MTGLSKKWQAAAEEAILDYFRTHDAEPFHSDDLWHVVPDQHRGVISLAVMAMVNKKLITGCGYRKSAIPSRKRSPSQEYRLTERGRDRLAGVSTEVASLGGDARPDRAVARLGADPGEDSSAAWTGGAEESRPTPEPLSLLPEPDPEAWAA